MPVSQRLIGVRLELRLAHAPRRFHGRRRMDVIEQRRSSGESLVPYQLFGVYATVRLSECDVPFARDSSESVVDRHRLEIPAKVLFALERLEQCFEVSGAEALCAFALNDLVEERRPIFHWLGEDL